MFDPVAVIRPRQPPLSLLNRVERQANGRFFNGVEGQLKTVLMRPPDQLSEHRWVWIEGAPALVQHDLHTPQADSLVSAERLQPGFEQLFQSCTADHHRGP